MKTLFTANLYIVLLMLGFDSYAQVRLGVKAGVNASNVVFESKSIEFDPLPGYQVGLQADIILSPKFSIQPALLYVTKGFSSELEFRNAQGTLTGNFWGSFRPNYLELPVLFLYKVKVGNSCKFFGGLGPYAAAGIGGKSNFHLATGSSRKILFGPKNNRSPDAYNRMDYGIAAAVGVEIRKISLTVNYDHGLTEVGPNSSIVGAGAYYNRSLALSAGYWFGKAR
ncbi:porin family protein [Persicitalea sp.]|uniref:porin family protein n=1 Tax=Persicitalea sp. TaxID=3100273 RepID=UPI003592F849